MISVHPHQDGIELKKLLSALGEHSGQVLQDVPVTLHGLQQDSRRINPGDLFVALAGSGTHGLRYAAEALSRGAAAIVFDTENAPNGIPERHEGVPFVPINGLSQKLGALADLFFDAPTRKLSVIGITGTNGKTSCSHFLANALTSASPSAVVGTLGWGRPGQLRPTTHTTPDAIESQRILKSLLDEGYQTVAIEASSHGLSQDRLNGIRLRGAIYTNLTRDHLDYHETMEVYREAKLKLLESEGLEFVVFNALDPLADFILERKPEGVRAIGFAIKKHLRTETYHDLVMVTEIAHESSGSGFKVEFSGQEASVRAPLFGDFNIENLAAVLAALLGLGWSLSEAAALLSNVRGVPGRMEIVKEGGRQAVIDYAHTPDALMNALSALRGHCRGKLWVVFGCGGDRDSGKRSEMGGVADRLADEIVVTDDNPRHENGDAIISDILKGIKQLNPMVLRNRRQAIKYALQRVGPNDLVLVAGKGHETTQEINGHREPHDDRTVARDLMRALPPAELLIVPRVEGPMGEFETRSPECPAQV